MQNSEAVRGWYRPSFGISFSVTETSTQARGTILWSNRLSDESNLKPTRASPRGSSLPEGSLCFPPALPSDGTQSHTQ